MASTPVLRKRSNSYGRNLRLLKGISPPEEDGTSYYNNNYNSSNGPTGARSAEKANKWLFEIAWEVANKGKLPGIYFMS